jgi:hypothetical protein
MPESKPYGNPEPSDCRRPISGAVSHCCTHCHFDALFKYTFS